MIKKLLLVPILLLSGCSTQSVSNEEIQSDLTDVVEILADLEERITELESQNEELIYENEDLKTKLIDTTYELEEANSRIIDLEIYLGL